MVSVLKAIVQVLAATRAEAILPKTGLRFRLSVEVKAACH